MAIMMFVSPFSDPVSEVAALVSELQSWLATQPEQRHQPMRVTLNRRDDGTVAGWTVETLPDLRLVK